MVGESADGAGRGSVQHCVVGRGEGEEVAVLPMDPVPLFSEVRHSATAGLASVLHAVQRTEDGQSSNGGRIEREGAHR